MGLTRPTAAAAISLLAVTALALAGCTMSGLASSSVPLATKVSGKPVELVNRWAGVCADNWGPDQWVEGTLVAGIT
jgi:hypothetical protein